MTDENKLRILSSKIIWGLSQFKPRQISEVGALLRAIEWFSAVAVDDWPVSDARHFAKEVESLIIFPFLDGGAFDRCLEDFIIECNGNVESTRNLHISEFKKLTPDFSNQEENHKMAASNESIALRFLAAGAAAAGVLIIASFPFLEGESSSGIGTYAFSSMFCFMLAGFGYFKSLK